MASQSLSSSLSYLCSRLSSLGLTHLSPRDLLIAAANHPSATPSLVSALVKLTIFQLAVPLADQRKTCNGRQDQPVRAQDQESTHPWFQEHGGLNDCSPKDRQRNGTNGESSQAPNDDAVSHVAPSTEDKLSLVKLYLAIWGYPPTSPVFALRSDTGESRHLLLAFAWLISYCHIFPRAIRLDVRFRPQTGLYTQASASGRERAAKAKAADYLRKQLEASNALADARIRAIARTEQVLMLYGKVRMALRALYASLSCEAERSLVLNQMQLADGICCPEDGRPYTLFELHLLEHKQALEKHVVSLESTRHQLLELVESDRHQNTFWNWMSAVTLEAYRFPTSDTGTATQFDDRACIPSLLPVLNYFQQHLDSKKSRMHLENVHASNNPNAIDPSIPAIVASRKESRRHVENAHASDNTSPIDLSIPPILAARKEMLQTDDPHSYCLQRLDLQEESGTHLDNVHARDNTSATDLSIPSTIATRKKILQNKAIAGGTEVRVDSGAVRGFPASLREISFRYAPGPAARTTPVYSRTDQCSAANLLQRHVCRSSPRQQTPPDSALSQS